MKMKWFLLFIGVVIIVLIASQPTPVSACTQPVGGHPSYSLAYRVQRSEVVIEGTVADIERNDPFETAVLEDVVFWKGSGPNAVKVTGFGSTAMCLTPAVKDRRIIIFARPDGDSLYRAVHFGFADAAIPAGPDSEVLLKAALRAGDPLGGATEFARAPEPTNITIMLDWTPNTNHTGLYIAQERGFYREANLNVTIQPAGDVAVDQVVAGGTAQFGISYQEGLTYSRANGIPVVSVAAIIANNTSGFVGRQSELKSPADLIGKRYGGFGSPIEKPIIEKLIACSGQTGTFDYVDIGFSDPFPLLERNRVDFTWIFYGWDGMRAVAQNFPISYLPLSAYPDCIPNFYTPILITSEQMIQENPEVVRAFVQATARGYAEAIRESNSAANTLLNLVPELDKRLVSFSARWLQNQYQFDSPRWGEQKREVWEKFTDFMVESGMLSAPIDIDKAFTNEFLPRK
ncbi:MAG: hypothetical protein OHK0023_17200 [Anaerolineae bacterium]